jgi:hypothetical protein
LKSKLKAAFKKKKIEDAPATEAPTTTAPAAAEPTKTDAAPAAAPAPASMFLRLSTG